MGFLTGAQSQFDGGSVSQLATKQNIVAISGGQCGRPGTLVAFFLLYAFSCEAEAGLETVQVYATCQAQDASREVSRSQR